MNRLARLSSAERTQVINEFKEEVFGGLGVEPRLRDRVRAYGIELPDDPTPDQVDAWIELAALVGDPGFRARLRTWMEPNTPVPGQGPSAGASIWWAGRSCRPSRTSEGAGPPPRDRRRPTRCPSCSATQTGLPYCAA
ncbi:hypothetical protein ABZ281_16805 [Streptomyces sp. NPDC006265]|uniref:hypothetical protein n=1 Tax=Streptomyces sp. NPDC006265 TaxID=3156740 RepID=UPI0033B7D67C